MRAITLILALIGIFSICTPATAESGVGLAYDETNFPIFKINDADFPDRAKALERMKQAFRDMLLMLRVACIKIDPTHEPYTRYFEGDIEKGSDTFLSIVCEAAGIKVNERDQWDLERAKKDEGPVNEKYKHWEIWAGKADIIPDKERPKIDADLCATTYAVIDDLPAKTVYDAVTELYLRAFDFPKLSDIQDKRGKNGLGTKDSGLMTSLGAQLLHESFHWRYLGIIEDGSNAADYNRIVNHYVIHEDDEDHPEFRDYIDDYTSSDPKWREDPEIDPDDGYGPVHTIDLVINDQGDSYRNADNYRWTIVSNYWHLIFETDFEDQTDNSFNDKMVPAGAAGNVPFPGEKPPTRFLGRFAGKH